MDLINAIAKARFASARPQCIQLRKTDGLGVEMLCMEPGQELELAGAATCCYVITGTAEAVGDGQTRPLPTGQAAVTDAGEEVTIRNASEGRLLCLLVSGG